MIKFKSTQTLKLSEQLDFLNELIIFLHKGHNIITVFSILQHKYKQIKFHNVLEQGLPIVTIFKQANFNNDVLLVIEICEQSNDLITGIQKAKLIVESKINYRKQINNMLKYPILILIIAISALLFLALFLLPQFMTLFTSMNIKLPTTYYLLINTISFLPYLLGCVFLAIIVFTCYYKYLDKHNKLNILLRVFIIKKYYLALYNFIFVSNLTNLLQINLTLEQIFKILKSQTYNHFLSQQAEHIYNKLLNGNELSECLHNDIYDQKLITLIYEAERYNNLTTSLVSYLTYLTETRQQKSVNLLFIIQPLFYLLFGILIIVMYSAIFVPMFEMMNQL